MSQSSQHFHRTRMATLWLDNLLWNESCSHHITSNWHGTKKKEIYRPVSLLFAQESYCNACSEHINTFLQCTYTHTYTKIGFSFSCILYAFFRTDPFALHANIR